jgi:GntR family transcriptional regulator
MARRMLAAESPVPLYHQLAQLLKSRIADGTYPRGRALPPETRLQREFGVARSTVRHALGQLEADRLIERRRGAGTYVRSDAEATFGQRFRGSLADLMAETKRARVVSIDIDRDAELPERIARALEMEGRRGTAIVRTRSMDDRLFAFTVNYLPMEAGERLTDEELVTESLMWLLERKVAPLGTAVQSVRAQAADAEVARLLEIPIGAPVLHVERLVKARDGRPVEVVLAWYRGDVYEYTVTFDLDETGGQPQLA